MRATRFSGLLCLAILALTFLLASSSLTTATASIPTRQSDGNILHHAPATGPAVATPTATSIALPAPAPATSQRPLRLMIPTIGVNASIEQVGILPNGNLATPTGHPWDDTGWYAQGPYPGAIGSAVIDGHLDRPGGYPAVFWSLRNLHPGDLVLVVNQQRQTLRFRVTRVMLYPPQEAPVMDIFANQSGTYLNLITCAGDWIPSQRQTTLRLVVYTTLL